MSEFDPVAAVHLLVKHGVRFVVIGGVAANVWGSPSITNDTDIVYDRTDRNMRRLVDALRASGARLRGVDEDVPSLLDKETIERGMNFTFSTEVGALDVLGRAAGAEDFERLYAAGRDVDVEGVIVRVADLTDLIAMKRAAGRAKDRAEVEILAALEEERAKRRDAH